MQNCVINKEEFDLTTDLDVNINQINNSMFEIKLKGIKNITDRCEMVYECVSFSSIPDISKCNTQNVTNMSYMFKYCKSLPDISEWNTQNVMSGMFSGCKFLSSIPDISKWNTQSVTKLNDMFYD